MVKIYFCGSIRGVILDKAVLRGLIAHLQTYGQVLTEHIGYDVCEAKEMTDVEIYERDCAWLRESDIVIAECSAPSLGVGYEIAYAEAVGKKHILCIWQEQQDKKLSAMVAGDRQLTVKHYTTLEDAKKIIDEYLVALGHKPTAQQ